MVASEVDFAVGLPSLSLAFVTYLMVAFTFGDPSVEPFVDPFKEESAVPSTSVNLIEAVPSAEEEPSFAAKATSALAIAWNLLLQASNPIANHSCLRGIFVGSPFSFVSWALQGNTLQ